MTSMIVAGVDGLRGGRDAVALGAALAAADDAELLLTGVLQETLLPLPALMGPKAHPLEETEQMLLQTRAAHAPRAITRPLSSLSPMRALCRVAAAEHAGTIAIGSAAAAPAGHARAGRDAHIVINDAPCSAALAARGLHERPFAIRSIVVGVVDGPEAEAALAAAARFATALDARLTAVTVLDGEPLAAEELAEQAREHPGVAAAEVRHGDPAAELARAAAAADLLVLGSRRPVHRSRGVGHRLTHDSPCSLLLVPPVS